jgi:hypothetical protein
MGSARVMVPTQPCPRSSQADSSEGKSPAGEGGAKYGVAHPLEGNA